MLIDEPLDQLLELAATPRWVGLCTAPARRRAGILAHGLGRRAGAERHDVVRRRAHDLAEPRCPKV